MSLPVFLKLFINVLFFLFGCSPDAHGSDLVPLLSQILTQCSAPEGSIASALALQSITSLCRAGIMDVASTWRGLAPKLIHEKRPGVIVRYRMLQAFH